MAELSHVDLDEELLEIVDKAARQNIAALQEGQEELKELCDPDVILSNAITTTTSPTMPDSYAGRVLIDEIGGVCEQETTAGNQLFDGVDQHYYLNGGCTQGGANSGDTGFALEVSGGTYTVSTKVAQTRFRVACVNELGTAFNCFNGVNKDNRDTVTSITIDCTGHSYLIVNATDLSAIMVNAGTSALPWEPYTGGIPSPNPSYPQEIKKTVVSEIKTHGVQFFNKSTEIAGAGLQTDTGKVNQNNPSWVTSEYIAIKELTDYCISQSTDAYFQYNLCFYDYQKNFVGSLKASKSGIKKYAFVTPKNAIYTRFAYSVTVNGNAVDRGNIMLNVGTDALPYEPYTESVITLSKPIELYGIGDVQDVIEGGKILRRFGARIYDGDENWKTSSALAGRYYVEGSGATSESNALCSCAKFLYLYSSSSVNECFFSTSVSGRFIVNTDFETVEEWKAHLASNPMTVVYEMAEETTEDLPLSDQIALNSLATYDGITYLEFDSEIEPTFKGRYGASEVGGVASEAYCDSLINSIVAQEHYDNKENPHGVTKEQVGLGNVENKSVAEILASLTKEQIEALGAVASALSNTVINANGNTQGVGISSGIVELFRDNVLHGMVGANAVQTNGVTYKTVNVRGGTEADFIALTNEKTNAVCYYMNINKVPFTANNYTESHYFGGDMRVVGDLKVNGSILNEEINFNKVGLQGGAAQPVEWVWDGSLQRWVLCTVTEQQE